MTFNEAIFWIFALVAVLPAVGILFSRGIVRMAFLLMFSLTGFAGLYLHLHAGFVGFTQVLVYIGGILVLFLFGVMLTANAGLPARKKLPAVLLIPEICAGLLVLACLTFVALQGPWAALSVGGTAVEAPPPSAHDLGLQLMSKYVLPFEAVSILLLAAMIGATYIARGVSERAERAASAAVQEKPLDRDSSGEGE